MAMDLSIPHDLKRKMDQQPDVDWSALACQAFSDKLKELSAEKKMDIPEEVVKRLRDSQHEHEQTLHSEGERCGAVSGEPSTNNSILDAQAIDCLREHSRWLQQADMIQRIFSLSFASVRFRSYGARGDIFSALYPFRVATTKRPSKSTRYGWAIGMRRYWDYEVAELNLILPDDWPEFPPHFSIEDLNRFPRRLAPLLQRLWKPRRQIPVERFDNLLFSFEARQADYCVQPPFCTGMPLGSFPFLYHIPREEDIDHWLIIPIRTPELAPDHRQWGVLWRTMMFLSRVRVADLEAWEKNAGTDTTEAAVGT